MKKVISPLFYSAKYHLNDMTLHLNYLCLSGSFGTFFYFYLQCLHFFGRCTFFFQITEDTSKTDGSLDEIRCIFQKTDISILTVFLDIFQKGDPKKRITYLDFCLLNILLERTFFNFLRKITFPWVHYFMNLHTFDPM